MVTLLSSSTIIANHYQKATIITSIITNGDDDAPNFGPLCRLRR